MVLKKLRRRARNVVSRRRLLLGPKISAEMSKLKKDLSAVRDRQTSRVKAGEGAAPPKAIKPQKSERHYR
jgi:hypothetical protein